VGLGKGQYGNGFKRGLRRSSTNYSTADSGAWRTLADDLFLERFRGLPCAVCGKTSGISGSDQNGEYTYARSCGHHIIEKDGCRQHRYNPENIIVLCPQHHSRFEGAMSPHSTDQVKQGEWWVWLKETYPEKYEWATAHNEDLFDRSWTYREMYERLGGKIKTATGLIKDMRPDNHAAALRRQNTN
jgi:hypothetical protein